MAADPLDAVYERLKQDLSNHTHPDSLEKMVRLSGVPAAERQEMKRLSDLMEWWERNVHSSTGKPRVHKSEDSHSKQLVRNPAVGAADLVPKFLEPYEILVESIAAKIKTVIDRMPEISHGFFFYYYRQRTIRKGRYRLFVILDVL